MFAPLLDGASYDVEVLENPDEEGLIATIEIARDEENQKSVFVETLLTPIQIDEFPHSEISFQITVVTLDESEPVFTTQMRDLARPYLPDACVPQVMPIVCESCRVMIDKTKPELLYLVTKEVISDPRGLEKYEVLNTALKDLGYVIYELDTDQIGRNFWKLMIPRDVKTSETPAEV